MLTNPHHHTQTHKRAHVMVRMYGAWLCVSSTGSLRKANDLVQMWKRQGYKAEIR